VHAGGCAALYKFIFSRLQGPVNGRRRTAHGRAEAQVAARHGQAVGFAHGRAHDEPDGRLKLAQHVAHNAQLLKIFLAHIQTVGLHDIEQAMDYRGHAAEMPGPEPAFHDLLEPAEIEMKRQVAAGGYTSSTGGINKASQ
jgi:hypothetical protein